MNRWLFLTSAAALPMLVDASLKSAALLLLAGACVLLMRRSSAAARHMVWLAAVVALLLVPVLSVVLPDWRVLPHWAFLETLPKMAESVQRTSQTATAVPIALPPAPSVEISRVEVSPHPAFPSPPSFEPLQQLPPASTAAAGPATAWLFPLWAIGCAMLLLRQGAAHFLLRRTTRRCETATGPLAAAFAAAIEETGHRQPVRLLIDRHRTIPVVWGLIRPRLLLPAEAATWPEAQLRSVLLHELAHLRRRDPLVQFLAQLACSLHWFNPLVWLAAWRLHVERERACDDMVLASGVRPSIYAEHLLHIATQLSPARWTQACGLAMARKSSLEGRLMAVLSEKLNRNGVTSALAIAVLILGAAIALPVAMLRAAEEQWNPPGASHIGGNDFSTFSVRDGEDTAFILAYQGDFDSMSSGGSNSKTRTWTNSGEITARKPGIVFSFLRVHTSPDKLILTSVPAGAQDLSKLAPPPRDFGQKEYDLAKGRVFLLRDDGGIRQLDIAAPRVTDQKSAMKLAALIAAVPPQERVSPDTKPKHQEARALYEIWQHHSRANGDIPGALVGELAAAVRLFIEYNPTYETVPQLNALLPRLDATRDWKSADVIALFDEMAELKSAPFDMASWKERPIRKGEKLPEKFADAAWSGGKTGGLRVAWMLEPTAAEYRIGTALSARLLVWNPGAVAVVLQVPTFHQGGVKATDAKGAEVNVSAVEFLTLADSVPVRLGPGEFIEINTPGVGIGPSASNGPWAGPRVGFNVLAKPGDELTLTHSPVPLNGGEGGIRDGVPPVVGAGWWLAYIKSQLARQLPLPADIAERTRLLQRAVRDLFGAAPPAEEIAAFTADQTPGALDALAKRLAERADAVEFAGSLQPAPAKFRVLAADSAAEKIPRVVLGPGEYPLPTAAAERGDATLKIVGRPVGDRRTNDAQLIFEAVEFTGIVPPDAHKLEVPDGWGTWAIVCRPSDGFLYLLHKGGGRKIDYSAPRKVTDTPASDLPDEFREEVKRQLEAAGVSAEMQAEIFEKPSPPAASPVEKAGAKLPDSAYPKSGVPLVEQSWPMPPWGEEQDGLSAGLRFTGEARIGNEVKAELWVRNSSAKDVKFSRNPRPDVGMHVVAKDKDGKDHSADITRFSGKPGFGHLLLPPGHIVKVKEFSVKFGAGKNDKLEPGWVNLQITPGDYTLRAVWSDTTSRGAAEGEWTGKLTTGEVDFKLTAANAGADTGKPAPETPGANMVRIPDDQYVKSGIPVDDPTMEGVVWNETQNGLALGYRIIGDEWRILGKHVKVELWVRNPCEKDVKFQLNWRPDIGLRRKLKNEKGEEKMATIVPDDRPPFGLHRLLPPGHALKVKEFPIPLFHPLNDVSSVRGHYFLTAPGAYEFQCELDLPGFTATGEGGKQLTPAEGEWTGKLTTRALNVTVVAPDAPAPKSVEAGPRADDAALQPKHEFAQSLFRKWQASARTDGKIPGGLIGQLAQTTDDAVKQITDADVSAKLAALRPRLDASRDWTQTDVVALLDDLTAIETAPVNWADTAMEFSSMRVVRQGKALPVELESAAWGAPAANGLRAAWLLEPRAEQYALGTVLKARVLFHNTGKAPVIFETETWHQDDKHSARGAKGLDIPVKATWFTGITPTSKFRLAPGEYCEVSGHGIAIGAGEYTDEHSTGAVGAIIEAKEGETVTLSHSVDAGTGGWTRPEDLWLATIAGRVANEAPMPASAADREQLIRRVTLDILGTEATAEEIAAFTADNTPDALAKLIARLQAQPRIEPFAGKLPTGETKFRVIAADPNAAKAPRTANAPGRYVLGDGVHLQISQTSVHPYRAGSRPFLQNKATILFLSPDPKRESPHRPHEIALPEGLAAYAFAWGRGAGKLWLVTKGIVRSYDFTNPAQVKETRYEAGKLGEAPLSEELRVALSPLLSKPVPDTPKLKQSSPPPAAAPATEKPAGAAAPKLPKLPDDAYAKPGVHRQKFREEDAKRPGGELMGAVLEPSKPGDLDKEPLVLGVRTASDAQWRIGGTAKVCLVVRNRSDSDVKFPYTGRLDNGLSVVAVDEAGKEYGAAVAHFDSLLTFRQMLLPVAHVATIKEFTLRFDAEKRDVSEPHIAAFHLPAGKYKLRCKWNDAHPEVAHEGEWTGELVNEELEFTLAAEAVPAAEKPKGAAAVKLTPDGFIGAWSGTVNEEKLMLSFHRPPVEREVQLDIYFGEATNGVPASFTIAEDGQSVAVVQQSAGGGMAFGTLVPLEAGKMKLELYGRQKGQMEMILTRVSNEPIVLKFAAAADLSDAVKKNFGPDAASAILSVDNRANALTIDASHPDAAKVRELIAKLDQGVAPVAQPASPRADVKPDSRHLFNEDYTAIALQSAKDVNFVLFYNGLLSSGITEWSSGKKWRFEGNIHLVDSKKTKAAGKNVDKRVIAMKFTSDAPTTLFLDGKAYELTEPGRVFVLTDDGEPFRTARTLPLRNQEDLVTIGDLAIGDLKQARTKPGVIPVRAQGVWSDEWQALSKVVAESRGLADWKADDVIAWGPEQDGLRSGLLMPARAKLGEKVTPMLVLKNVSGATKEMNVRTSLNVLEPTVHTADGKTFIETRKVWFTGMDRSFPVTLKAGEQFEFAGPPVLFGIGIGADGKPLIPEFPTAGVVTGAETVRVKFHLGNVRGPETGEVIIEIAAANAMIRGKVLNPDGTAAAGVPVRVDDGIERWKFRGEGIPDLPKPVTTAADGTFSIEVPKHSVATNYNVFADSDAFAPMHAVVPAGGEVGVMQFAKGSRVTGRVFGLDGAGLAKVGIWCKQLEWRGPGPAPSKLTSTGADGTFSIPSIATGRYLLVILTRDLGEKELTVAFANPVIEVKDNAPVEVEIRPLPTVDLTLDAQVLRGNLEFSDFELRVSGTLPGHKAGEPAAFWTRQETTKLTEGKHTIAVPAGLQNATLRADRIYMRKGDDPVFIWRREGDETRVVNNMLELGHVDKPQTLGVTVQDAAK